MFLLETFEYESRVNYIFVLEAFSSLKSDSSSFSELKSFLIFFQMKNRIPAAQQ